MLRTQPLLQLLVLARKREAALRIEQIRHDSDDAQALLDEIVAGGLLQARGVYGFWPARADGDDVLLDEGTRFCFLRQQTAYGDSRPNRSLADRLAEAFAEYLHERARREWYEPEEQLSSEELIAERFSGIRPAFGYPACPDHSEKRKLFDLLGAEQIGLELTETFAMIPAAAVSGIYLAHPQARYFSVGRLGRDQVEDYAGRKGLSIEETEYWLRPNLGYEPERAAVATT